MKANFLRKLLKKMPKQRFEVHLTSGQKHTIRDTKCATVLKNTLVIGDAKKEPIIWFSLDHVTSIHAVNGHKNKQEKA